jgi:hypothetical protein
MNAKGAGQARDGGTPARDCPGSPRLRRPPDILAAYPPQEDGFAPGSKPVSYAVVYVRPETNSVLYERAIAAAIRSRGEEVIYLANLNGGLLRSDGVLEEHYVTQLRFAEDPLREAARYPEIARRLAHRFGAPPGGLDLIGSLEAASRTGLSEEELFETFVPPADFLSCWGQQFKRIGGAVVANPGLPAVLKRYTPQANVFVAAVRSADGSPGFFAELNRAIYREITSRAETPLMDAERLGRVPWSEKVRRTYHISRTHLMAMFDMADFVYLGDKRLQPEDTPLGRSLLAEGILTAEKLQAIQRDPLVRLPAAGGSPLRRRGYALHYLPLAGEGKSLAFTRQLLGGL